MAIRREERIASVGQIIEIVKATFLNRERLICENAARFARDELLAEFGGRALRQEISAASLSETEGFD